MVYPKQIAERADRLAAGRAGGTGEDDPVAGICAQGAAANFACGSLVRFRLSLENGAAVVRAAGIRSNGCGYMLAAADVVSEVVDGRELKCLKGLGKDQLHSAIADALGEVPTHRVECIDAAIEALQAAFAALRARRVEEFRGEEPLICTCFGVTQEKIELFINERAPDTVEDVAAATNAGSGCGSCRMLIQELLDIHADEQL